ncbi:MAG TPA: hypothetical protein VGR57_09385, partial [Ktedonobacterales bacterium]|nr:hypothetical protein [Ktedonobacterales bacterium]
RTAAAGNFTSSVASTTYFLDLNPDGTMSWGTAHSGQANYLPICSVTTDGSQNLVTISDARTINTTLLSTAVGTVSLQSGHINADTGKITSDGNGNLTATGAGPSAGIGTIALTAVNAGIDIGSFSGGGTSYVDFHSSGNSIDYDARILGEFGSATVGDGTLAVLARYVGFRNATGAKLMQIGNIPSHGAADVAIGGTTYWTTVAQSGFNNSASFSSFDVAEVFTTDQVYAGGTVVCPVGGLMRRCTHPGCHAASVVSKTPGFAIGDPVALALQGETAELCALVGRVRVVTSDELLERDLVIADGHGGVRAMRHGEEGFSLGVALDGDAEGRVGVLLRPMYCVAP